MNRFIWLIFLGLSLHVNGQSPDLTNPDSTLNIFSDDPSFQKNYYHYGTTFYLIFPSINITGPIQLNATLNNQGAPTLGRSTLMAGMGLHERTDLFCFGGEFITGESFNSNDRYELTSSLFMLDLYMKCYVFSKPESGGFYPFIGFNSYNQTLHLTDISTSSDLNGLFTQSGSVNLKLNTLFLNGGIGYDLFNKKEETSFYGSIKMGIRRNIGSEGDNQWFVNEKNRLPGAPSELLNSFYIQLGIGVTINYRDFVTVL